ncbi:MAG: Gfo/Idh/MocA family oxidoreductase [Candidatus Omnitrophota bacterium]|nr:Gfo/Idh/MocA family oxidoreductase [Candidatus Omnitrophota bacterium]
MLNVAVIGVGKLGSKHAQIYSNLNNVNLLGVCDINKQRAESIARQLHVTPFIHYQDLLGKVKGVTISTPTSLHYQIARDFLNSGVNVLIEKPMTLTLSQADRLIKLSEQKRLSLLVGHVERFNSVVHALKKLSRQPKFIEVHRLGAFTPRVTDVGVVLDLMIHDIDIVLALVKSEIKKIETVGINVLSHHHEDIANARITFKNSCIANLTASRLIGKSMRKIRIFQEDTYISLDYLNQSAEIHRKVKNKMVSSSIDIKKEEPLRLEIKEFINYLLNRKSCPYIDREARDALKIALQIVRKLRCQLRNQKK